MDYQAARQAMINGQIRPNKVIDTGIIAAFESIPREAFLPLNRRAAAYIDEDLPLSHGRYILQPAVLGQLIQAGKPDNTDNALIVAGSAGYCAALLSRLVHSVHVVDNSPEQLAKLQTIYSSLALDNISVETGNPVEGLVSQAPYSLIIIDGGVMSVPPALSAQLEKGGRLLAIVRADAGSTGVATLFQKSSAGDGIAHRALFDAFVPLLAEFCEKQDFVF